MRVAVTSNIVTRTTTPHPRPSADAADANAATAAWISAARYNHGSFRLCFWFVISRHADTSREGAVRGSRMPDVLYGGLRGRRCYGHPHEVGVGRAVKGFLFITSETSAPRHTCWPELVLLLIARRFVHVLAVRGGLFGSLGTWVFGAFLWISSRPTSLRVAAVL